MSLLFRAGTPSLDGLVRAFLLALLLGGGLVLPSACGGGDAQVGQRNRPSADVPEEQVSDKEAVPTDEPLKRYSYNAIGKRDPFRSFISRVVVVEGDGGPVGPLQVHEIDQYRLRGIVWNISPPRALVEDPDGMGYVVDIGTLIGKNWGKVTKIKPQEIIITEEYRDPIENELIINEITMRLPDPYVNDKKTN